MAENGLWKVLKFIGVDKAIKLGEIVKQYGGIMGTISQIYRTDMGLKDGTLVGVDEFGNKYYENNRFPIPKNRWVDFSKKVYLNYDASMVPPKWHRWLTFMTDKTPTEHPPVERRWMLPYEQNRSLHPTKKYVPYSTVPPKIDAWEPPTSEFKS